MSRSNVKATLWTLRAITTFPHIGIEQRSEELFGPTGDVFDSLFALLVAELPE